MTYDELIIFMVFVVGFALTPGPNMMLYLTYTFEYGRKAGWATAAGIVSAFVFHIIAIIMGLTALLVSVPSGLQILKYAGIAYLLYLAYTNLKIIKWKNSEEEIDIDELSHFYVKGLIGNLLNPGSVFLYFALLPQFIKPDNGDMIVQNLSLGVLQMVGSFITNCILIYFAGYATAFFKNEKYQMLVRYCMSILIVLFALKLLLVKI